MSRWASLGVDVECVSGDAQGLDLREVLHILAQKYMMTTLYCEGGARLHGSLFDLGLIDQVHVYMAPKLTGGAQAAGCIGGVGVGAMSEAQSFEFEDVVRLGRDVRLSGRIHSQKAFASL